MSIKCYIITGADIALFPLRVDNLRIELVENASGQMCLTEASMKWVKLWKKVDDVAKNKTIKDQFKDIRKRLKTQAKVTFVKKPDPPLQ